MIAEHEIRIRSYLLWESEGRPQGRDMEFWFRAKAQLEAESAAPVLWRKQALFVVPRASVSTPPRKMLARRVAPLKDTAAANAATR